MGEKGKVPTPEKRVRHGRQETTCSIDARPLLTELPIAHAENVAVQAIGNVSAHLVLWQPPILPARSQRMRTSQA